MIIDTISNLYKYVGLNPLFADVVEFLKKNDLNTMEEGKHPILGDRLFVNITTTKARSEGEAILETHVEMVDIQLPLDADETYGYTPLKCLPESEYDAEKDISFYGDTKPQTYVTCQPGQMVIFFPQDGHAPCISEKPVIKKAIFKVKA
jgi:YhcH/YjgK/YiaL family protein